MIRKIFLTSFSLLWIFIIFAEYLYQHNAYAALAKNFQYYNFLILLVVGIGGFAYLRHRDSGKFSSYKALNGLGIFGLTYIIMMVLTILFFSKFEGADFSFQGAVQLTLKYVGVALATYLCGGFAYLLGDLMLFLFPLNLPSRELFLIKIAVGIMFLVAMMFLLGFFNLLYGAVIILLFVGTVALNLRGGKDFVKNTLLKPITISPDLNLLGIAAFAVTLVFVTLNFTQIIRPIAIGFDAMTLYMRIPSLIGDYHGLINGHSAYNWSIFMSLGFVVFDTATIALALSYIGGPLALFAIFALCRRWMNVNLSLLVVALFYSAPQINFLSFQDMKIDLGLLFISMTSIFLLVNWVNPMKSISPEKSDEEAALPQTASSASTARSAKKRAKSRRAPSRKKRQKKKTQAEPKWLQRPAFLTRLKDQLEKRYPKILQDHGMMVWLGLLIGFAFGIKFTSVMLLMGVLVVIWYTHGNAWMSFGVMVLCLFGIFLLELDKQSGTRGFHSSVTYIQWVMGALGVGLLAWQALKKPDLVWPNVKRSVVILTFFLVAMSPWFIKNVSERRSVSVDALLNGKSATPSFNGVKIWELRRELQKERKNQ